MAYNIFGFEIRKAGTKPALTTPANLDGAIENEVTHAGASAYGYYLDLNKRLTNEVDLINKYRAMAQVAEIDAAIEDIVNESIVVEEDKQPVSININSVENDIPEEIQKAITIEFNNVMRLLEFHDNGHDMFRQWYIDGRYYSQIIVDETDLQAGIQDIRNLDPRKIKKVRDITKKKNAGGADVVVGIDEYFVYNENGTQAAATGIKLSPDTIIHAYSGLVDEYNNAISYLHKAIKPSNQLRYMEDAALIYTLSRAPSRRVFYIDIADMPKQKADQYMQGIMTKYKNKIVYDSCLAMDTKIPLLDGRTLTISEIQSEFESGKQLWAYSCDPVTGKFSPGMITSAGVTRFNARVMKITLDNGKSVTCTLDHKFPVWNKGNVEAQNLCVGDSMIPLYKREKVIHGGTNSTYEQIFDNYIKKWIYTHRAVSEWKDSVDIINEWTFESCYLNESKNTVHHINYDRYDNSPENLVRMHKLDHFAYHKQHNSLAGKIGGAVTAQRRIENDQPYVLNWTKEQAIANGRRLGRIIGKRMVEERKGIHGLSPEETLKNAISGNQRLQQLLQDAQFNLAFRTAISNGWSKESRNAASERAKNRTPEQFKNFIKNSNVSRWSNEQSHIHASKIQSIIYTDELIDAINEIIKSNVVSKKQVVNHINQEKYIEIIASWKKINSSRAIKLWNPHRKFGVSDIDKIYKSYGVDSWKEYVDAIINRNHKIVKIEFLEDLMDVGTLGIDKYEVYHDNHTFALDIGIYTCNSTGEIKDDRVHLSMLEDYWLPRRSNGRTTEITTLASENITGQMDNVMYFMNKLYGALNVPLSRLRPETGFSLGRSQEISRDEVKFSKFIDRLRKRFSGIFLQALRVQLVLKGIITPEDWEFIRSRISFDFMRDNYFSELKDAEILASRIQMAEQVMPLVGTYYSPDFVRRRILRQTDEEIEQMREEIAIAEKDSGAELPDQQDEDEGEPKDEQK